MNDKKKNALLLLLTIFLLTASFVRQAQDRGPSVPAMLPEMSYGRLFSDLDSGAVSAITVAYPYAYASDIDGNPMYKAVVSIPDYVLIRHAVEVGADVVIKKVPVPRRSLLGLVNILPSTIFLLFLLYLFLRSKKRGGKGTSSSISSYFLPGSKDMLVRCPKYISMQDVAGIDEVRDEVYEIISFLRNPGRFEKMGSKIPRGFLLCGPPGCGKTLLVKAIASEANVPFFATSGSDFVELFVGMGALKVRNIFSQARSKAPCIIFIDEIDAVGGKRAIGGSSANHEEREQTLNQILVEMDGFNTKTSSKESVIVIGATNRHEALDRALLRPGRFTRKIFINLPDVQGRQEIMRVHSKKVPLTSDVDFLSISKMTAGFSGADIENLINEASIRAVILEEKVVNMKHFEYALEKIMMGIERKKAFLDSSDREVVAFHEAGHTIVAIYTENANPIYKVTIIPRSMALGMLVSLPKDSVFSTAEDILAFITVAMGGRVAEKIRFDKVSNGALSDIQVATDAAYNMVEKYGMSNLGTVYLEDVVRDSGTIRGLSNEARHSVNTAVNDIVSSCEKEAFRILREHEQEWINLAKALLKYKTLDKEEIFTVIKGGEIRKQQDDSVISHDTTAFDSCSAL